MNDSEKDTLKIETGEERRRASERARERERESLCPVITMAMSRAKSSTSQQSLIQSSRQRDRHKIIQRHSRAACRDKYMQTGIL